MTAPHGAAAAQGPEISPLEEFVNTESQNHLASMLHMRSGASPAAETVESLPEAEPLLPGKASRALQNLTRDGQELSQALEARLDSMQESFMTLLHHQMETFQLGSEERLHLYLSPEGRLVVEGSETDAEKVCELISNEPTLQRRFRDLARLALLSRGVEVACLANTALQGSEQEAHNPLFSRYHMCLKGPLSHFYVR